MTQRPTFFLSLDTQKPILLSEIFQLAISVTMDMMDIKDTIWFISTNYSNQKYPLKFECDVTDIKDVGGYTPTTLWDNCSFLCKLLWDALAILNRDCCDTVTLGWVKVKKATWLLQVPNGTSSREELLSEPIRTLNLIHNMSWMMMMLLIFMLITSKCIPTRGYFF